MGRAGARSPAMPGGPGGRGTGHGLGHGPGRVRRAARRRGSLLLPEPGERPGGRAREPRAYAPLADWLRAASIINPAVGIGWARGVGGVLRARGTPKGATKAGGAQGERGLQGKGGPRDSGGTQGGRELPQRRGVLEERESPGGLLPQKGVPKESRSPEWDSLCNEETPKDGDLSWVMPPQKRGFLKG